MSGYNYLNEMECRSGVQPPSGVASRRVRSEMRYKSIPQFTPEQSEQFWTSVEVPYQPSGCWIWKGSIGPKGYGRFSIRGHNYAAHRVSRQLLVSDVTPDKQLDHLCRNRLCVNPDHVEPATNRVNVLRGYGPTAINSSKTSCNRGHAYTPENTYLTPSRPGERACRICKSNTRRAYRRKFGK
jgi:hypothetical protein